MRSAVSTSSKRKTPAALLALMVAGVPLSFATWQALLNNFAVERAQFTGAEMGVLQSLREIPGFLAFAVVFLLLLMREQTLAWVSLLILGLGTAVTGFFPNALGLYVTTVLMSIGFHYFETVQTSLSLQWVDQRQAPEILGRLVAVRSLAGIVTFALVWFAFEWLALDYQWVYLAMGGATVIIALYCAFAFPRFHEHVPQHKHLVFKRRYWLYYALTFMSGARRQIFVVFAGFLLVEKFGYSVEDIALLFLLNAAANVYLAPRIGRLIGIWGERRALVFEYAGLILVFVAYAVVENETVAAGLYVIDHLFFALAIAIKTYFQKIADAGDIASSAGVGFTISHLAAVFIPAVFGLIWLVSPAAVFLSGAVMAGVSLLLSLNVPRRPEPGKEVVWAGFARPRVEPIA